VNFEDLPTEAKFVHDPVRLGDEAPGHGECQYCVAQVSPDTAWEQACAAMERYHRWEQRELNWEADPEWRSTDPFGPQRPES
jgi:hypothetical protein